MRRKPVDSSSLASVGYEAATRTLEVEFRSGWIYRYHEVGADMFERLMKAESKGRFMTPISARRTASRGCAEGVQPKVLSGSVRSSTHGERRLP